MGDDIAPKGNTRFCADGALTYVVPLWANSGHQAVYSITSSARASSAGGTDRSRLFAVLRLIASSYLVGACTGKSAGFSPLRIRSTYPAARRNWSKKSAP